jgi:transposase InsO family protein
VDHHIYAEQQEALMPHRNAPLTETGRLRLARCVVEDRWPVRRAAERFQVSHTTAARWAARYREHGAAGMSDRSSRPRTSPHRTPVRTERRIVRLRVSKRLGPARIAWRLGLNPATVHRVLARYGCPPLAHLDRGSGRPVRRYERSRPGELIHVDVKKLGNIPDGGGHRVHGRQAGKRNSQATTTPAGRTRYYNPILGYGYLHTAPGDYSRLAYTEILADERKETAAAFLARAHAWYAAAGITIERVLSDNGSCYRSALWAATCAQLGITPKRTRPYRPQTNGKVERFHRTLADEWAYARPYTTETQRRAALDPWLHTYNHHRGHTALKGLPPASRVTNLSGQNT